MSASMDAEIMTSGNDLVPFRTPLPKLAAEVEALAARVDHHLERRGFHS
jgi:hypothetical protein